MTDLGPGSGPAGGPSGGNPLDDLEPRTVALLTYGLFVGGILIPILPAAGLVVLYLQRAKAPAWLAGHYIYLERTFWIALAGMLAGVVLTIILIGPIVALAAGVWFFVRSIVGLLAVLENRPLANPRTWTI